MMKQIILLLALVSSSCMLFSPTNVKPGSDILEAKQVGDTLVGKHVKYKFYRDKDDVFLFCRIWRSQFDHIILMVLTKS